ncbi:uncharacterized protein [Apostichopus japonicus]|uniref:uncharacterized protein n=1 Tax=Stichopus japonicus TaxID=307972 RepID=UPI003AB564C2
MGDSDYDYSWDEDLYLSPDQMSLNTLPVGINMLDSTLETDFMSHAGGGSKKRNNWPNSILRLKIKISSRQKAKLARSYLIKEDASGNVRLEKEEKLIIMFKLNNRHAIFRLKDGAVAVLKDAIFNPKNPPTLMDGSKYKEKLLSARVVLFYAISKIDQVDENEVRLRESDVLLVVAQSPRYVVGVTAEKKVGIFKASSITLLTEPRLYIGFGKVLSVVAKTDFAAATHGVKSIESGTTFEIFKESTGLFTWFDADKRQLVFLQAIQETTLQQDSGLPHERPICSMSHGDARYYQITERVYGNKTISEKRKEPLPQPHVDEKDNSLTDESLQSELWFFGKLSREEAEKMLIHNGDFLVRYKTDRHWEYVLSFKHNNVSNHMELLLKEGSDYKTHGGRFKSVRMLVHTHFEMKSSLSHTDKTMILITPLCRDDYDLDESKLFHQYPKDQRSPDIERESLSRNQQSKEIRESTSIPDDREESTGKNRPFVRKAINKSDGKKKNYDRYLFQATSTSTDRDQGPDTLQGDSEPEIGRESLSRNQQSKESTSICDDEEESTETDLSFIRKAIEKLEGKRKPYTKIYVQNLVMSFKDEKEGRAAPTYTDSDQDKEQLQGDPEPAAPTYTDSDQDKEQLQGDSEPTCENVEPSAANGNSQDKSLHLPTMTTPIMASDGTIQEGVSEPNRCTYMASYETIQEGVSEPTTPIMASDGTIQEGVSEPVE